MKRSFLVSLAAAPLLAGCTGMAKVRAPDARPPAAYEAHRPEAKDVSATALDAWWTLYDDAQLSDLIDRAFAHSPDARDGVAKLRQAAAIREQSRAQIFMPTGNPSATATRTYTDILDQPSGGFGSFNQLGYANSGNANFNVSWELDLFGRRVSQSVAANSDFQAAAYTYAATRTALAANVAQSLFQLRGLALQLQDAQEASRIDDELLNIAQVKVDRGLAAGGDLDQAVANAESAKAQVQGLTAQITAAQRALLVLVGQGFDPAESIRPDGALGAPPPVPDAVPGELLRRRPDVLVAEQRIRSAAGTLKLDQLALLPTIKLNPGVTLSQTAGPFGATTAAWSIGANLTAPILDRPRLMGQLHAQRAVAEQAVIAYEKAVQTAYADTETAFVYLDSDRRRVVLLTTAEARAQAAYNKSRVGYARGLNDLQTALVAETTWRNIRGQLSAAKSTLLQRSVQVFKALGGGWTPEAPAADTAYAALSARGVK
jgi:NodT family efflux transporter outer membrane factor (OMF) lipoprotein